LEAADFLNHTMGLNVSPEDVARLTMRTEGWIAGLQMAALSIQNTDDISAFISTLSGSHHYIFDYLLEEILTRQSDEIRSFLLSTSILERLTAPICDALLADDSGSTPMRPASIILDELEHANLFIIPLDHDQHWYRYHPLFAELLRGYLRQYDPEQIPTLHSRASAWFEEQGSISEAIRHSFAANDWERVIRLISANIFALLEQNELNSVARQLENLTGEAIHARPWLLVGRAWLAAYTGQLSSVEPILKLAEGEIDSLNSETELQTLGGHIAAIRAYTNWIGDKREIAANAARAALEWLPESEYLLRCQAATLLGLALSDFKARTQALKHALMYARRSDISHVTIFAHGCWAWLLSMQGGLQEARAACYEAIQLAESSSTYQPMPTLSHVYSTLSFVLCELNDIEGAVQYSKDAVYLARHWEQADALHFALDNLGQALFASGDIKGAFVVLRQTQQVARSTSAWFEEITLSQEVEWHLASGNLEAAKQCLHRANVDIDEASKLPIGAFKSILMPLTIVQIFIAQNQQAKALEMAGSLIEELEKRGMFNHLIKVLAWQALIHQGLRQDAQALESLKRSLTLAAPEGYARTFIKIGPGLIPLLHKALAAGITPDYVNTLILIVKPEPRSIQTVTRSSSSLIEPLSEREMDVLRLLAQGCADKKIAESLVIARETVHKHLKNIYGKLEVHSRSEAIVRARELDLL
jgi:LuxR family maltose regulon positive regulatory protein